MQEVIDRECLILRYVIDISFSQSGLYEAQDCLYDIACVDMPQQQMQGQNNF